MRIKGPNRQDTNEVEQVGIMLMQNISYSTVKSIV